MRRTARADTTLERLEELLRSPNRTPAERIALQEAIEHLATMLEEVDVAEEELRHQNEELSAAAQSIETERSRYRELFDLAPDAYLVTDLETTVREANRAAGALLNVEPANLLGKPLIVFVRLLDGDTIDHRLREANSEAIDYLEARITPRNREPLIVRIHLTPAHAEEGRVTGWRWIIHDISQLRRAQEQQQAMQAQVQRHESDQLRKYAERMAELDKTKSDFLKLVSHELRGPISVLRGYASMLRDETLDPKTVQRIVPILVAKTEQMNLLVNEMLETARLEEGRLSLTRKRLDLRDLVRHTLRAMEPLAAAGGTVTFELPSTPVVVNADRLRLETIVANLVDNAIKFSPDKVVVACTLRAAEGWAEIAVTDHGLGIAPSDVANLFTRFGRLVTNANSHLPGTGLGLYISRELARLHGGDITVRSQPGTGSTFTLRLPLAPPPAPRA